MAKRFNHRKINAAGILEFAVVQVGPYVGDQTEFVIQRPDAKPVYVTGLAIDAVEIAECGVPEPRV